MGPVHVRAKRRLRYGGALTRATRDGDYLALNGSKIWSTYAYRADFGLALVRTNWDVPKHRGLTMVIVPIRHPGITVTQITMVDGSVEFCQEFFDNALVPVENVVGAIDDGWTIATRLLFHERHAVGGSSPYLSVPRLPADDGSEDLGHLAERLGRTDDPGVRELLGEAEMLITVERQLRGRLARGIASGRIPETGGSMLRLLRRQHLDSPGDDRGRDCGRGRHRLVPGLGTGGVRV